MITSDDIFEIPCSRDIIHAGINYALIAHAKSTHLNRHIKFLNIYQPIGEFIARLSLIHLLTENKISYSTVKTLPFTQPELYQIVINGWRWCIHANFVSKNQFFRAQSNPEKNIEKIPVLISVRKLTTNGQQNNDIHIFVNLIINQITKSRDENPNSVYCYLPNNKWNPIRTWTTLSPLVLINNTTRKIDVQIGGLDKSHTYKTNNFLLNPSEKLSIKDQYYAITDFLTLQKPDGTIELKSIGLNTHEVIPIQKWTNCWIDVEKSIFLGYCTQKDFQKHAYIQSKGTIHPTVGRLQETYWAYSAEHLFPLRSLMSHTKNWQSGVG